MTLNPKVNHVNVKIKQLHQKARIPSYRSLEAAGADLSSIVNVTIQPGDRFLIPCGFAIELPVGYEAQVRPRSGLAFKQGITVLNSPGTIDSDYRGEIKVLLINHSDEPFRIEEGDRIAQMLITPVFLANFEIVDELGSSDRGENGFGSSGVKS